MLTDSLTSSLAGLSLAVAAVLVCGPPTPARRRLAAAFGVPGRGRALSLWASPRPRRRVTVALGLAGAVLAVLVALAVGPAVVVALALFAAAVHRHGRARRRSRAAVAACEDMAVAVRAVVAELAAGAHPVTAVESAAAEATAETAAALRGLAASARLGGMFEEGRSPRTRPSEGRARPGTPHRPEPVRAALARLTVGWSLAREHGIPLAGVLDAVRRDVESTVRSARQTDARMAGPRAGAGILALLPLAGLALGEAMGARPLHVLTQTATGSVLLVVGAAFVFVGVAWSCALTGRVAVR